MNIIVCPIIFKICIIGNAIFFCKKVCFMNVEIFKYCKAQVLMVK